MFDERARWAFVDSHDGVQSFGLYIPAASASSQSLPALQLPCPITIIPSKRRKESERPIPLPVKEMQPVSFTRPRRHRLHDYRTDGDLTKNEVTFLKEEYKRRSVQQYTSPGASLDAHAYRVPFKDKESKGKSLCAPLLTATGKDCVDFYAYTFRFPVAQKGDDEQPRYPDSKGETKVWTMMLDYETGFVKSSPVFKSLGHLKGDPSAAIGKTPGFHDISVSLTGGKTEIQGFWLPYGGAFELFKTFAYEVRAMLYPIFGYKILRECEARPRDITQEEHAKAAAWDSKMMSRCTLRPAVIIKAARNLPRGNTVDVAAVVKKAGGEAGGGLTPRTPGPAPQRHTNRVADSDDDSVAHDSSYFTNDSPPVSPRTKPKSRMGPKTTFTQRPTSYDPESLSPEPNLPLYKAPTVALTQTPAVRRSQRQHIPRSTPAAPAPPPPAKRHASAAAPTTRPQSKKHQYHTEPSRHRPTAYTGQELARRQQQIVEERQAQNMRMNGFQLREGDAAYELKKQRGELVDQRPEYARKQQPISLIKPPPHAPTPAGPSSQAGQDRFEQELARTCGDKASAQKRNKKEMQAALALLMLSEPGGSAAGWQTMEDRVIDRAVEDIRAGKSPRIDVVEEGEETGVTDEGGSEYDGGGTSESDVEIEDAEVEDSDFEMLG